MDGVRLARTFSMSQQRLVGVRSSIRPHRSGFLSAGPNGSPRIWSQPLVSRLMRMHRFGFSCSPVSTGCHYVVVALTNSIVPLRQLTYFPCRRDLSSGDRRRRLAECFATAHDRPRNPRHLVGHRDRHHTRGASLEQRVNPAGKLGLVATITDHRGGAEDE